jgi:hypothetical protein
MDLAGGSPMPNAATGSLAVLRVLQQASQQ